MTWEFGITLAVSVRGGGGDGHNNGLVIRPPQVVREALGERGEHVL